MGEYDVNKKMITVTEYKVLGKLPDPFLFEKGNRVSTLEEWEQKRAEIYKTAIQLQYGTMPPEPQFLEIEKLFGAVNSKNGVYKITTGTYEKPVSFRMELLLPERPLGGGLPPVIIDGDLSLPTSKEYYHAESPLKSGIALVRFDRTELAHDVYGEGRNQGELYKTYPDQTFGAIGAWAWGYSRCVDALEKINATDPEWIIFTGHSRGGKTCALAGALDKRAKVVNPNSTCAGACGCYRLHMKALYEDRPEWRSEDLNDLWTRYGYWMGPEMGEYTQKEEELPFDTHMLKALIAPRILFISESAGDIWSNPIGSWQTTLAAGEVYKFLGAEDNLFWYFRPGFHLHAAVDMKMLINIVENKILGTELDDKFFKTPFEEPELIFDWRQPSKISNANIKQNPKSNE